MIGKIFSHYRVIEKLGSGGMGVLYRAEDLHLGRHVALKFLSEELAMDGLALERFQREARAASALNHPGICTIHDFGIERGLPFIVMEILEGEPLNQRLARGRIETKSALELACQMADALEAAHSRNIVHRDIKPSNIFLTARGLKILDFGLAKLAEPAAAGGLPSDAPTRIDSDTLTTPGAIVGTIVYMSPEQARGEKTDARSDIFSFGAVLYEMAAGRMAFPAANPALAFDAILNHDPPPISETVADCPARLEAVIFRTLDKDPAMRPASMGDLLRELKELLEDIESDRQDSSTRRAPAKMGQSIAVMPFADMSAEQDQEYFCDGMAEELINALANTEGLQVVPRISAFQFKGKNRDVHAIGRQLRVKCLLEGSVRKAGSRLRITAQLIDVATGRHVWSDRYDRDMADIFAIQDEIARNIVGKLKVELRGDPKAPLVRRYTEDIDAYHLYLKGRFYWNKRYEVGVQKGMSFFQQAIEKDPNYALAYTGLADSLSVLATYNFLSPTAGYGKAEALAERSLALDDSLAEAHTSIAYVRMFHDWQWTGAETHLKRAIALNPSYAVAHYWYGVLLGALGRFPESLAEAERARDLDPMNSLAASFLGWVLLLQSNFERSISDLRNAVEIEPNSYVALSFLGIAYTQNGQFAEALAVMEKAADLTMRSGLMMQGVAMCHAYSGNAAKAREIIAELLARADGRYLSPFYHAGIHVALGEYQEALDWLDRGYAERDGALIYLGVWPIFNPLRSNSRFQELVRKMNYPPR